MKNELIAINNDDKIIDAKIKELISLRFDRNGMKKAFKIIKTLINNTLIINTSIINHSEIYI